MASQENAKSVSNLAPSKVSLWTKVQLAFELPFAFLFNLLHKSNKRRSWRRAVQWVLFRHMTSRRWRSPQEMAAALGPSTGGAYRTWAKKAGVAVVSDSIDEGAKLHWIGERGGERLVLYFHGGGFVMGPTDGTFPALQALKEDLKDKVGDVGFVALEYSFVPTFPFPTQLSQATAALSHLLSLGISPSNIILAGDSAGGNLVLQVLSHILHPLPSTSLVPPPPKLETPLGGALLISPWVSYNTTDPSFATNKDTDIIPPEGYAALARACAPGIAPELSPYVEPFTAPAGWWDNLQNAVKRVLLTAGEKECLLDMIVGVGKALEEGKGVETRLFVEEGGVHEEVLIEFGAGEGRSGSGYKEILGWLGEGFGRG